MKLAIILLFLFVGTFSFAQEYSLKINAGNHDEVISSCYDAEKNELITLDRNGFVVTWNAENYSIKHKFQIPPATYLASSKISFLSRPEIQVFKSLITITHTNYVYNYTNNEDLVDVYDRATGVFKQQSKNGVITRLHFFANGTMLGGAVSTTQSGNFNFFSSGFLLNMTTANKIISSINISLAFTFLKVSNDENTIAVGYEKGKLELRDANTLKVLHEFNDYGTQPYSGKVCDITFAPNNQFFAYTAFDNNTIFIRNTTTGALIDSFNVGNNNLAIYKLSISPSSKFIAVTRNGQGGLHVYDVEKKVVREVALKTFFGPYSNVFFKNDNILLATGRTTTSSVIATTTNAGKTGAFIGLIDWKNQVVSANFNLSPTNEWISEYGTSLKKIAGLESILFSPFGNFAFAQPQLLQIKTNPTNPFDLENDFIDFWNASYSNDSLFSYTTEKISRVSGNVAMDCINSKILSFLFHKKSKYSINTDTFFVAQYDVTKSTFIKANIIKLPFQEIEYGNNYQLVGSVASKSISLFTNIYTNEDGQQKEKILLYDKMGKKVFENNYYTCYSPDKNIAVSTDEQYVAFQNSVSTIAIVSLKNYTIQKIINTGFVIKNRYATGFAFPEFAINTPNQLIHQVSKVENGINVFCLVKTNISNGVVDTLVSINTVPVAYHVDSFATNITLAFNYNFGDTSVWSDNGKVKILAEQNFKKAFQPTLMVYNVLQKTFTQIVAVGNVGINAINSSGNWFTVVQHDGQIVYINKENTKQKITHIISNEDQVLVADSFYYATKNMLPYVQLSRNNKSYAATQIDVLLNKPHAIMQQFLTARDSVFLPYQLAYNKRLQQLTNSNISNIFSNDTSLTLKSVNQTFIYTKQPLVTIPIVINGNLTNLKKVTLFLNNYPISGRKGLDINSLIKNKQIELALNVGDNYITVNAEQINGTQLTPLRFYYYYNPTQMPRSKLWIYSVGVSNYKDSLYNLKYAAKDATDILQAIKYKSFDTTITRLLTNEEANEKNILLWKKEIEKTGINDVVILYFAGHGLLDKDYNFYFATHDADFMHPEKRGLRYETILDILEISSSRKKILLLDACHSGAFDKSIALKNFTPTKNAARSIISSTQVRRSTLQSKNANTVIGERQAFILMNELFTDFSNDVGVDVIAASLGNSYALETPLLQNGLFTYSLIRAIGLNMAAGSNKNILEASTGNSVSLPEIKSYLNKEVRRLSNGAQVPSIRSNTNFGNDITFYNQSSLDYVLDKAYLDFIEKYKR